VQAKLIVRPAIAFYSPDQGAEVRFCYNRPFLDTSRRAHVKAFAELTEREILAVAVFAEEEDSRIYLSFAEDLAERYPESAKIFEKMAEEEKDHRHQLLEMYEQRFGPNLPPIRREDVKGFLRRRPIWLTKNLPVLSENSIRLSGWPDRSPRRFPGHQLPPTWCGTTTACLWTCLHVPGEGDGHPRPTDLARGKIRM